MFLWLLLDPSLGKGNFEAEPYQSAHHLGHEVGPLALSIAATFVAYLIGTFFNEIRGLLAGAYLKARRTANLPSPTARADALANRVEVAKRMRLDREERWRKIADRLDWTGEHSPQLRFDESFRDRARASLARLIRPVGAVLGVPFRLLDAALRASFEFLELYERAVMTVARQLGAIRLEPYKPFLSRLGVAGIKRYLGREWPSHQKQTGPGIADVISDFPVIRNRLIHHSSATVSEVDRLHAEAEFRSAIVPPLMLIAGLLGSEVSWWWILAWPPLLALLATARARRREAGDLMADALVQEVVQAPSVEVFVAREEQVHQFPGMAPS